MDLPRHYPSIDGCEVNCIARVVQYRVVGTSMNLKDGGVGSHGTFGTAQKV